MHLIYLKKSLAILPAEVLVQVGIKHTALVFQQTIVKIALNILLVLLW
jgi:hypothetical protein